MEVGAVPQESSDAGDGGEDPLELLRPGVAGVGKDGQLIQCDLFLPDLVGKAEESVGGFVRSPEGTAR
ncbi:MAG: hypothetical protein ACE5JD_00655 [Candidatus Methylomirabilia bacterium]